MTFDDQMISQGMQNFYDGKDTTDGMPAMSFSEVRAFVEAVEIELDAQEYSDLHKEAFGVRPTAELMRELRSRNSPARQDLIRELYRIAE